MQAMKLPTNKQVSHLKDLIRNFDGYLRGYKLGDLSKREAEELIDKLEVIAIYTALAPQEKKAAYRYINQLAEKGGSM